MFIRQRQSFHSFPSQMASLNQHLEHVHHQIKDKVPQVDRISFTLYDAHLDLLRTYAESDTDGNTLSHHEYPFSECRSLQECANKNLYRVINDIATTVNSNRHHSRWLIEQGYLSSFTVPTYHHNQFIGFINFNSHQSHVFSPQVQNELMPFCEQINFTINSEYSLVHSILTSAELTRDIYPGAQSDSDEHILRVSLYAKLIALEVSELYELDDETIEHIHLFSRLHDIGKIALPDTLLLKPITLNAQERKVMESHVDKGLIIINKILHNLGSPKHPCIQVLKDIMAYHHEFLDGSGYPNGASHSDIPVSARIVAVANIFDALTSHRPYAQTWCVTSALLELEKMVADGKLDGNCVNVLRDHQGYITQVLEQHPEHDPREGVIHH
ncbi:HD domain-containing phosphohydrolase [Vibrio penaeicida]|uniref:HD domain-containing phosphohydrolase n=1 Tax=Vibrio penaeicida TaxID=104609 RepID=UPI001CC45648|nr:HD domain-containing phosphohydrolase [Vibrio penaeicida]